jgi:hypothetical protein
MTIPDPACDHKRLDRIKGAEGLRDAMPRIIGSGDE